MHASSTRLRRRLTLMVMIVFALLSSGCSSFPIQPATPTPTQRVTESPTVVSPTPVLATATPVTPTSLAALTDPASLYCIEKGGRLEIRSSGNSGHIGVCILDDGTLCEQWSFYRGECQSDQTYNLPSAPPSADDEVFAALFADVRRR
jgi:putative hemolysin